MLTLEKQIRDDESLRNSFSADNDVRRGETCCRLFMQLHRVDFYLR